MKNLQLFNLEAVDNIVFPDNYEQTTLDSPARCIFTDFKDVKPLVIDAETLAADALTLMAKAHVQMKMVISEKNDFLGIVSTKELTERRIVKEVAKGLKREEILVKDMMIPRDSLLAFNLHDIETSTVNHIITSMKSCDFAHVLVVDDEHHIRGVISSSDIARKLHLPLTVDARMSFVRLYENLN